MYYMYDIGNGIQNMKKNDKWVYIASTHQLNSPKSNRNDPFKQHPLYTHIIHNRMNLSRATNFRNYDPDRLKQKVEKKQKRLAHRIQFRLVGPKQNANKIINRN